MMDAHTICKNMTEQFKPIEHDGCSDCIHFWHTEYDYPCVDCKGTAIVDSYEYKRRRDFYEPSIEPPIPPDMVDHPAHYNRGGMETIDEMIMMFGVESVKHFCKCNAWKYRARAAYKGNPEEDMAKSHWYLAKYKELEDVVNESYRKLP